jgi:hypothetical protein
MTAHDPYREKKMDGARKGDYSVWRSTIEPTLISVCCSGSIHCSDTVSCRALTFWSHIFQDASYELAVVNGWASSCWL